MCGIILIMERRTTYFVSRKNVLTWIAAILLLCSVAGRIAYFCGEKGAEATALWMGLILPLAAAVIYGITILFDGKEHVYRTAASFGLMCIYYAWVILTALNSRWFGILMCVIMLVMAVIYNVIVVGKIRHNWLMVLILLAMLGTQVYLAAAFDLNANGAVNVLHWNLASLADIAMTMAVLFALFAMTPHLDSTYHPTWGDRPEGRRVRTIPPISYITPYIMPDRNGANNCIHDSVEITELEKFIHKKRREGMPNFGLTHIFMAAYVRCVAMYPALNRFLSGQHVYTRDRDIQFNMTIKKEMTTDAPDTCIKLHLDPADTIYEIYEKFDKAVEEVKTSPLDSDMDKTAALLTYIPGVLLKFVVWLLKTLDYFGLLPKFLLEVSPFHGSVFFTSMGSLGIPAIVHHLYNFGNIPAFCAFGCKRRANELDSDGNFVRRKYVDFAFNLDERTVDGFYYATVLKTFKRLLAHPERLEVPPETVLRDIN